MTLGFNLYFQVFPRIPCPLIRLTKGSTGTKYTTNSNSPAVATTTCSDRYGGIKAFVWADKEWSLFEKGGVESMPVPVAQL